MATRHQVRNSVVSLLYAHDFNSGDINLYKDELFEERKIRNKQREFANKLLSGVIKNLPEIDQTLMDKLTGNWGIDKLGKVEKAVLRLGVYEIVFEKVEKAKCAIERIKEK